MVKIQHISDEGSKNRENKGCKKINQTQQIIFIYLTTIHLLKQLLSSYQWDDTLG